MILNHNKNNNKIFDKNKSISTGMNNKMIDYVKAPSELQNNNKFIGFLY